MVYKTNNPLEYNKVDGIVSDETAPAPQVQSAGVGTAILVGVFSWGPTELSQKVSQRLELFRTYMDTAISGMDALINKSFSSLRVVRVDVADAVKAAKTFQDIDPKDSVVFTAKYKGAKGNDIQVKIEDGTNSGKKYSVKLNDSANVSYFPEEIYDDVALSDVPATFANSKLVVASLSVGADTDPENTVGYVALTLGSNGAAVDTDYQNAIAKTEVEKSGNVVFLDVYNEVRNGYLKATAAVTQDKMVICAGPENQTVAEAVTAADALRDVDGRIIYAYNWLETTIRGVKVFQSPASFMASIISNIGPHIDPAYAGNSQYLYGVSAIKNGLSRPNFITLKEGGISSFEFDSDIGFKVKSGIVTQILNSEKVTILRRRMTDFLVETHARFFKLYQNDTNSLANRKAIQAAMYNYIETNLEKNGVLPKDSEVSGGKAKIVDITSLNDDISIGEGFNYILYKQRIYSSMRFIVLKAEIGTGVVVEV